MVAEQTSVTVHAPGVEHVGHRQLLSAGAWLVLSFAILSVVNYAFSLALSHLLSITDYGSFGVLSSILLLQGLVATAGFPWMLSATVARYPGPEHVGIRTRTLSTALLGNAALGVASSLLVAAAVAQLAAAGEPVELNVATHAVYRQNRVTGAKPRLFGGRTWKRLQYNRVVVTKVNGRADSRELALEVLLLALVILSGEKPRVSGIMQRIQHGDNRGVCHLF